MVTGTRSQLHKIPEWFGCSVAPLLCVMPLPPSSPLARVAEFARLRPCTLLSCRFPSRVRDGRRWTVAIGLNSRLPTVAIGHVIENIVHGSRRRGNESAGFMNGVCSRACDGGSRRSAVDERNRLLVRRSERSGQARDAGRRLS